VDVLRKGMRIRMEPYVKPGGSAVPEPGQTEVIPKKRKAYRLVSLTENRDFRRIYAKGKSWVSPVLITYVTKNRWKTVRVGITTSKKTGNAVKRNRSRRVIREAFRGLMHQIPNKQGVDLVFVARAKTPFVKSTDIKRVMAAQLKEAGVLK
jgi:ribonuclease P protein component